MKEIKEIREIRTMNTFEEPDKKSVVNAIDALTEIEERMNIENMKSKNAKIYINEMNVYKHIRKYIDSYTSEKCTKEAMAAAIAYGYALSENDASSDAEASFLFNNFICEGVDLTYDLSEEIRDTMIMNLMSRKWRLDSRIIERLQLDGFDDSIDTDCIAD